MKNKTLDFLKKIVKNGVFKYLSKNFDFLEKSSLMNTYNKRLPFGYELQFLYFKPILRANIQTGHKLSFRSC